MLLTCTQSSDDQRVLSLLTNIISVQRHKLFHLPTPKYNVAYYVSSQTFASMKKECFVEMTSPNFSWKIFNFEANCLQMRDDNERVQWFNWKGKRPSWNNNNSSCCSNEVSHTNTPTREESLESEKQEKCGNKCSHRDRSIARGGRMSASLWTTLTFPSTWSACCQKTIFCCQVRNRGRVASQSYLTIWNYRLSFCLWMTQNRTLLELSKRDFDFRYLS